MRGQTDRRQLNKGIGDGLSRSLELIVTPALVGGIGFGLDRVLGTTPLFTIVLGVFGLVGTFLSFWYRYDREMRTLEAQRDAERRTVAQAAQASRAAAGTARSTTGTAA